MTQACSPAEFIEQCRLAIDPVRAAQVFHVRERLRNWLALGAGRECITRLRMPAGGGPLVWWVELFETHSCVASVGKADLDDAIAHALQSAESSS